jgi:hypothetical protein
MELRNNDLLTGGVIRSRARVVHQKTRTPGRLALGLIASVGYGANGRHECPSSLRHDDHDEEGDRLA